MITLNVSGSGKKGFEVSPQDAQGNLLGTIMGTMRCQLVGSNNQYITHTSASSANPATWAFNWTAPAKGTGNVTFYDAFVVGKPNLNLSSFILSQESQPNQVLSKSAKRSLTASLPR